MKPKAAPKLADLLANRVSTAQQLRDQRRERPETAPVATGDSSVPGGDTAQLHERAHQTPVQLVYLDQIQPDPEQPRALKPFDLKEPDPEVEEEAASIREIGQLQPLLVERKGEAFLLIAGERRWRAMRHNQAFHAGTDKAMVLIWDQLEPDERLTIQLHENLHRKNLTREEKRDALVRKTSDLGNVSEVCRRFHLSRSTYYRIVGTETVRKTDRVSTGQFVKVAERLVAKVNTMPEADRQKLLAVVEALYRALHETPPAAMMPTPAEGVGSGTAPSGASEPTEWGQTDS